MMRFNGDIDYLAPELMGRIALSEAEKKKTKKVLLGNAASVKEIIGILLCILVVFFGNRSAIRSEISKLISVILCAAAFLGLVLYFALNIEARLAEIKYETAAYGSVVQKDVIYQKVPFRTNPRLMPFNRLENVHMNNSEAKPFYYLTVKLDSGKYVRYVNCLKKDFQLIGENERILIVYLGNNQLIGVRMAS